VPGVWNLKPLTRDRELLLPHLTAIAGDISLVTISGKIGEPEGVLVAPWTRRVMPLVAGISTFSVQVTVPVQVRRTVSPSLAADIVALIFAAVQFATLRVAAEAGAAKKNGRNKR
jgi:hypothetical protein